MYFDEFIKQHIETPKNLNKTSFSVSQTADAQTDGITLYNSANMVTIIALAVVWVFLLVFIILKRWKITLKENNSNIEDLHPCKTCHFFFANKHYLKCAVHPSTVLTKQAINCPDYCVEKNKFFRHLSLR